jgi:phenylpropionate dioxygenase-like ring-hydroxylating dioxygenase large terminal subunit
MNAATPPAAPMPSAARTVAPAPAPPVAMHAWVYRHPELSRLELERVLMPSWQIVCHINSIARPGDYQTFDLGPESVLVLRDRDGELRGYHNVCRHRGARLLDGAGSCAGPITCPYHGWSYRHDGSLVGVPARDTFPALERDTLGLKPLRLEVALGFVFVCLAGDPPPVAQTWGRLAGELAPYRFDEMVPLSPITTDVWNVDWKIAMDNYLESYHVPVGHPGLNRMFTPDYEDQSSVPGVARGVSWMREQPSSRWSERMYQGLIGRAAIHLPERERRCWRFYSMLPNLGIDVFPDQMDFFQLLPGGPGRTLVRGGLFGLPGGTPELRAARFLSNRINAQVNAEDRWLCERVQRGLGSSSYRPGPLSRLEGFMHEFHKLLRERIPELAQPQPPERFAPAGPG